MANDVAKHTVVNRLRLLTTLLVCLAVAEIAAQSISEIRIDTPRDFAYTIGDTIRHEMQLSLNEPFRLDTTTLPESGRLNRWLEISRTKATVGYVDEKAHYRVTIDYQIFNAPQEVTTVTIPQQEMLTTGRANPIAVYFPEWTFIIGPVTNPAARENLGLRPDRQPQPVPVGGRHLRLLISSLLLAGLLIYLGYRHVLYPRLKRNQYPFATALHELRNLQRLNPEPANYRLGLQAFHSAVNATAGRVVFTGNLLEFLAVNSKFAVLKSELLSFYARSQDVFFNDSEIADAGAMLQELVALCRDCRALERALT